MVGVESLSNMYYVVHKYDNNLLFPPSLYSVRCMSLGQTYLYFYICSCFFSVPHATESTSTYTINQS